MSDDGSMGEMDVGSDVSGEAPLDRKLPAGIEKEVLTAAPVANWRKPEFGDEVAVHYVGTLATDGTEFDSSRARAEPLRFNLGKGQVIAGWDRGVATMKKGEVAKFTLAPEFAYGEKGSPPQVPENATLIFEVELLSWVSRKDLFNDDGVIKSIVEEGTGYQLPEEGSQVNMSFKALAADGTVIQERANFDYVIGSEELGSLSRAVNKALVLMKQSERVSLQCRKEYAYGDTHPDGVTVELVWSLLYETKDVSFQKDGSVMKRMANEETSWKSPHEGSRVVLVVETVTDGESKPIAGFVGPKTLEFVSGDGDVCDALECAVVEMKKGESALVTVRDIAVCRDDQLGLANVEANQVVFKLKLLDIEDSKDAYSMSDREKMEFSLARKDVGAKLFQAGRLHMALQRYTKVTELLGYTSSFSDEGQKLAAEKLKRVCELNKAACMLKVGDYAGVIAACDQVLAHERENVKALYRRANARFSREEHVDAEADLLRVLEVEPDNVDAKRLLPRVRSARRQLDQSSKSVFAKMCQGFGKLGSPDAVDKENAEPHDPKDAEIAAKVAAIKSMVAEADKKEAEAKAAANAAEDAMKAADPADATA